MDSADSNFVGSDFTASDFTRSDFTRSDFTRSDFTRSNFTRSNLTRSDFNRPDSNKPDSIRPEFNRLDFNKSDSNKPEFNRLNFNKSDSNRPEFNRLNFNKSDSNRPEFNKSDCSRSDITRSTLTNLTESVTTIGLTSIRTDQDFKKDSIICVVEGGGGAQGEIGFAAFDKSTSTFIISQYIDDLNYSRTLNKIEYFEPNEILLLKKKIKITNDLRSTINQTYKQLKINLIERKQFNPEDEMANILKLCCEKFRSIEQDIRNKYYCIGATSFLLSFIESDFSIAFKNQTLKIIYSPIEQIMNIDPKTAKALEILTNQINNKESLFSILNKTHTVNGARMLKKLLLEPLTDEKSIKTRLDCVQELVSTPELFEEIETILKKLDNLNITSVVISFLYNSKRCYPRGEGEKKVDNLMRLKNIIEAVEPVKRLLKKCDNYLFRSYSKQLEDDSYHSIGCVIDKFIREDCRYSKNSHKSHLKFDLFKDKTLLQLDLIKKLLKTDISKIRSLVVELNEKYTLPFSYRYNNTRKFFLNLSEEELNKSQNNLVLPKEFYNVKKSGKFLQFTCDDLDKINVNFEKCLDTFFMTCNSLLNDPIDEIRKHIFCLYKFIDIISMIDLLQSYAKVSSKYGWNKPSFSDQLSITKCDHPFYQFRGTKSTTNNFHLSIYSNIAIITGPNNSGKTTFIKQIVICQLLAQIGCFVPCEMSTFRIMDRLFARMGSDNDFDSNSSSFMNELKEITYILNNCTGASLIAIDELGRGTSAEEGWPFCWSIIEKFVIKDDFVLFATHFKELTILAFHYLMIDNYYMETVEYTLEDRDMLRFTYKLLPGVNQIEGYGIKLAEQTNMPKKIIDDAKKIREALPTNCVFYKYLNSKTFKLKRLNYEIGKLALRYKRTSEKNPNFNYIKALESLSQFRKQKRQELEQLVDELTEEELSSLGENVN